MANAASAPFRGGDDHPLHRARGVPGDEQARAGASLSYLPVRTVPFSLISHPRSIASFDRCDCPVVKNSARRAQLLAVLRR